MKWSLHGQLRLIITPVILLAAIAPAAWITSHAQDQLLRTSTRALQQGVEVVTARLSHYHDLLRNAGLDDIPDYVDQYQQTAFHNATFRSADLDSEIIVLAADGEPGYTSAPAKPALKTAILQAYAKAPITQNRPTCGGIEDGDLLYCAIRFEPWQLTIFHAVERSLLMNDYRRLWIQSALLIAAILAISFIILFYFLDRVVVRRILELSKAMDTIDPEHLQAAAVPRGADEIGRIGEKFDEMLQRLRSTLASRDKLDREVARRASYETELQSKISELQRTGQQLRAAKAEQDLMVERLQTMQRQMVNQEKLAGIGQLAAGVAHEINSPIAFVSTNLNVLTDYVDELLQAVENRSPGNAFPDPAALEAIGRIREDLPALFRETQDGISRVRKIVDGLRTYGHRSSGETKRVDLRQCMETAINLVRNEFKYHATATTEYSNVPCVQGDDQKLTQVFVNLLLNAAQATSKLDGRIRIRIGRDSDSALIEIEDNGVGMPEAVRHRIFEPFFTTKEVGVGTGLGLAIVHGIIDDHGGSIEVTSSLGQGTTFSIHLPVSRTRTGADHLVELETP